MSTYLCEETTSKLNTAVLEIVELRKKVLEENGVDILVNDTINNLLIQDIVKKYDENFEVNMGRNGEDARTKDIDDIELKCCTLEKNKKGTYPKSSYAFHAMGELKHDSYMFVARDKATAQPFLIFDIRLKANTEIVYNELLRMSDEWYEVAKTKKTSYDVIRLKETYICDNIKMSMQCIDGVTIFKDYE